MKKISLRTILIFTFAALSGGLLFYTSQNVQRAEDNLRAAQQAVLKEQEAIRVLNAEWAFLNSPARLETLAAEYLDLIPPGAGHIMPEVSSLPDFVLPEAYADGFQDISLSAHESEDTKLSKIFVKPRKKPIRRKAAAKKRFDTLLNELEKGGRE